MGRSAWSSGAHVVTTRANCAGFGTLTAGAIVGGEIGPPGVIMDDTEEYNGAGWATTGNSYAHTTMNVRGCGNAGG